MAPGSSTKSRGESSATPLALASAKGQVRVPVCHFRDARDGAGFGHDGRGRVVVRLLRLSRCGIAAGVQRNDDAVLLTVRLGWSLGWSTLQNTATPHAGTGSCTSPTLSTTRAVKEAGDC